MKVKFALLSAAIVLSGCATKGPSKGEIPSIESQTFNTKVPGETIKIDKSCGWSWNRDKCEIETIEAVGVQPSVGATRLQQRAITIQACDNARANIVGYVFGENVRDSRYSRTKSNQNENQKDRSKSRTEIGDDVPMSATDSDKDTNYSVKEALINTDIDMVRTITTDSQGRLVGFRIAETSVVDGKTMACRLYWSRKDSQDLGKIRSLVSGM